MEEEAALATLRAELAGSDSGGGAQ
jgi:hypothetical protein